MILSTHAITGAALATFVPAQPAAAFVLGFLSHFALDAIPHWDYPLRSPLIAPNNGAHMLLNRALVFDLVTIGFDALFGLLVAVLLFATSGNYWAILSGVCGAMLPDALQFLYARFPREPLRAFQRFHEWMHTDKCIKPLLGIGSQFGLVVLIVSATIAVHHGLFGAVPAIARGGG